jgi:hypothetical protein
MLDSGGRIKEIEGQPVCVFCHMDVPDQSASRSQVTFRADVAFLCWRCHPPMDGQFFKEHFLVKPSKKTLRIMRKSEREQLVAFPLLNRDRVTCSTCHNPHESGVLSARTARAGEDEPMRLRLPKEDICFGCHNP